MRMFVAICNRSGITNFEVDQFSHGRYVSYGMCPFNELAADKLAAYRHHSVSMITGVAVSY